MNNTILLCLALGWQGGTVHQVAAETGLTVEQIIDTVKESIAPQYLSSDFSKGMSSVRTCSLEFNRKVNFPNHKGNLAYWMGTASGIELSFKLKEAVYGTFYDPKERGWV